MSEETKKGEIIIYRDQEGPEIQVTLEDETVWLSQVQMAELFKTTTANINQHIKRVYFEHELEENRTIKKFLIVQKEGGRQIERRVNHYNLDVIISVGYRVKSQRGTQFRMWATQRLRDYLLKGYAINQDRLKQLKDEHNAQMKELEQTAKLFQYVLEGQRTSGYEKDLLKIITDYAETWSLLHQYDAGALVAEPLSKKKSTGLSYEEVKKSIATFKTRLAAKKIASDLFGQEIGGKLKGALGGIEQTFDGKDLYRSIEEKAAHLLYFIIKDHPFADGNKRIGSLLFMLYLVENRFLLNKKGERKFNDNALAALALLVAESHPHQKETMIKLIINLVAKK